MEIDVDVLEKDINTSVDSEVLNASATEENIVNASVEKENVIDCSVKKNIVNAESDNTNVIKQGETDHSKLDNLDYESSGHTGFASEKYLNDKISEVEEKIPDTSDFITSAKLKENNKNLATKQENYSEINVGNQVYKMHNDQEQSSTFLLLVDSSIANLQKQITTLRNDYNQLVDNFNNVLESLLIWCAETFISKKQIAADYYTKTQIDELIKQLREEFSK